MWGRVKGNHLSVTLANITHKIVCVGVGEVGGICWNVKRKKDFKEQHKNQTVNDKISEMTSFLKTSFGPKMFHSSAVIVTNPGHQVRVVLLLLTGVNGTEPEQPLQQWPDRK